MVGGSALLSHGRIECPGEHLVGIFAVPGIERIQCYVPFCLNVEYLEIILSGACQLQGVVFQVGDSLLDESGQFIPSYGRPTEFCSEVTVYRGEGVLVEAVGMNGNPDCRPTGLGSSVRGRRVGDVHADDAVGAALFGLVHQKVEDRLGGDGFCRKHAVLIGCCLTYLYDNLSERRVGISRIVGKRGDEERLVFVEVEEAGSGIFRQLNGAGIE